jgi:6,7-dimethyl-8-ribityllumazine synthase
MQPEAIIAFGAVIRGGTPHFEYVCNAVTDGILQLNMTLPIPVIFGVLTLDTEAQAYERLGGPHGHKGEEAALTALKMIKMNRELATGKK